MAADDTTLVKIRDGIAEVLQTIPGLKVYDHSPRNVDQLPGVELGLPPFRRAGLGEPESEYDKDDLFLDWPLALHVQLRGDLAGQTNVLKLLGQLIGAFDTHRTLSTAGIAVALEARLVAGDGTFVVRDENDRPLDVPKIVYDLELHVHKLVS